VVKIFAIKIAIPIIINLQKLPSNANMQNAKIHLRGTRKKKQNIVPEFAISSTIVKTGRILTQIVTIERDTTHL